MSQFKFCVAFIFPYFVLDGNIIYRYDIILIFYFIMCFALLFKNNNNNAQLYYVFVYVYLHNVV